LYGHGVGNTVEKNSYYLPNANALFAISNGTLLYEGRERLLQQILQFAKRGCLLIQVEMHTGHMCPTINNFLRITRGVAVDLGTHCNIGSKKDCCPLASNY